MPAGIIPMESEIIWIALRYFPEFRYNGTRYDSGVLFCENPSDRFKCSLRGGMLMKSGAMLNFSVEANAKNDHLNRSEGFSQNKTPE